MNETRWPQLGRRDEKKQKKSNSAGRAEGRQDGFANPYQLHSLWWRNYFELHRVKQRRLFLRHKLNDHLDRGRATWHDKAYRPLRMLASHIVLYLKGVSWNPLASLPMNLDWIHISPQWNRSASTEMMFPFSFRVPSLWWSRHLKFALTKKNSSQCRLLNVMCSKIH